jgi:hypothetical protein
MKTHENMRAINAWMCPWLIAAFGKNYADWDNCDAAMLMLSHIIVTHEIGGYTVKLSGGGSGVQNGVACLHEIRPSERR